MTKTAIFRCDASLEIGSGHVVRCLTLADALREEGWQCSFAASAETFETVALIQNQSYAQMSLDQLGAQKADLLIVDHYGLDAEFEMSCRSWAKTILVIDDLADRPHDCDILLDQTYGRPEADYRALTPAHCKILTGAEYALLRPQFAKARAASLQNRSPDIHRILVSLGGTNIHNVTSKVLEALNLYDDKSLESEVVLGPKAFAFDEVEAKTKQAGLHNIQLLSDVEDMAALMARADLAIGAGGTTSWERCALGLPTLSIEIADNQALISSELEQAGAIVFSGRVQDISAEDIKRDLQALINDQARITSMIEAASSICDGMGVNRVVKEIGNVC